MPGCCFRGTIDGVQSTPLLAPSLFLLPWPFLRWGWEERADQLAGSKERLLIGDGKYADGAYLL